MQSTFRRLFILPLAFGLTLALVGTPVRAQKLGKHWHADTTRGFKFKPLDKYAAIPLQSGNRSGRGLIAKFKGPVLNYIDKNNRSWLYPFELLIFSLESDKADHTQEGSQSVSARPTVGERMAGSMSWFTKDMLDDPTKTKAFKSKGFSGEYKEWRSPKGSDQKVLATYTFPMSDADLAFAFTCTADKFKKYAKVFNKSMKSLQVIARVEEASVAIGVKLSYDDQLALAEADCEKTNGWKALPTPSKKFIIKTSSENKKFIKAVIQRLEMSRKVFEKDFPPPANFDAISVVRICSNAAEFGSYGNTSPGVAGWFSPSTKELVLYDAVESNRNKTYAVMSHEAFHQYCHYIFDQTEAHRWFDEGHGDYYGGIKIKGQKTIIQNKMPGGLNRLDIIKAMVANGTYAPLKKHLNFNHQEWQNQGPSNVSCYSQSWSIIYMLRQGALGKLKSKYWKKAYANILPNYVKVLNDSYEELRMEKYKKLPQVKKDGVERDSKEGQELWYELRITEEEKGDIWKKAMDASWGQIDLEVFEGQWLKYVKEVL